MKKYFAVDIPEIGLGIGVDVEEGDSGYAVFSDNSWRKEKEFTALKLKNISLLPELDKPHIFRMLGILSKEATWVKPGDRFSKDELFASGIGNNWDEKRNEKRKEVWQFKIKGPCGHFH